MAEEKDKWTKEEFARALDSDFKACIDRISTFKGMTDDDELKYALETIRKHVAWTQYGVSRTLNDKEYDGTPVTFVGTPSEVISWVHTHFTLMEKMAEGASNGPDENEAENRRWERVRDALQRSLYAIQIMPTKMVAMQKTRPEFIARANRIFTGIELFDVFTSKVEEKDDISLRK